MSLQNREEYLRLAVQRLAPLFEQVGAPLPADIAVSVGFPSTAARARKEQRTGECWSPDRSAAKRHEIFISPVLGDASEALAVLVHELAHAAVGAKDGHRGRFPKVAKKLGLQPPMRATTAGPELKARLNALIADLGPYPHAALDASRPERKPQATRLLKVVCPDCGAVDRTTATRISRGLPWCDCGQVSPDASEFPSGFKLTRMIVAPESIEEDEVEIRVDPLTGRKIRIPQRADRKNADLYETGNRRSDCGTIGISA
jgi:hypothetical protein